MNYKFYLPIILISFQYGTLTGQEATRYKIRLDIPFADLPQNISLPYKYPSMYQSLEWSRDFYELAFWGIDELGDMLFQSGAKPYNGWRKFGNNSFKYLLSLGFSKYGSELPIPLGVWGHEEFHRSVLGVNDISSINGNWILRRWDGTVYGVSDLTLENFKFNNPDNLLYSYVAGVQYEILLNERITLTEFYFRSTMPRAALILYNAYYVFDYFRFSTSSASDSVKVLAPPHEDPDPTSRDYAGADLTAWVHDMFHPYLPFTSREPFPGGEGVNRRIGYSDLSVAEQNFLKEQKTLSLLNFLNPAIFFINRIDLSDAFSFMFFTRYTPTHFGNDLSIFLPVSYRENDLLITAHSYNSQSRKGIGVGLGLFDLKLSGKVRSDLRVNIWNQPESFLGTQNITGGYIGVKTKYSFSDSFSGYIEVTGKTKGWILGNPYLGNNASIRAGICYDLPAN